MTVKRSNSSSSADDSGSAVGENNEEEIDDCDRVHKQSKSSYTQSDEDEDDHEDDERLPPLQATPWMCFHCFEIVIQHLILSSSSPQSLGNHLQGLVPVTMNDINQPPPFWNDLPNHQIQCPLFVTWEKQRRPTPARATALAANSVGRFFFSNVASRKDGASGASGASPSSKTSSTVAVPTAPSLYDLRGCIGTLSPTPLATALTKYALMSAFRDQRFVPIHPPEIASLRVAVSLLVRYEECKNVYDWQVGVHGIMIKFSGPNSSTSQNVRFDSKSGGAYQYSATYLPEVAMEQGWDQVNTVASLIRKAGYNGDITQSLLQNIHCTRYQSSKLKMTFEEYVQINHQILIQQRQQREQREHYQRQQHCYPNTAQTSATKSINTMTIPSSTASETTTEPAMNYAYRPAPPSPGNVPFTYPHSSASYSNNGNDNTHHCNIL